MSDVPLSQHALLSDCGAAALVTSGGSVDWLCLPRFDSAPVFARLLDDEAGHFMIAPTDGEASVRRRYLSSGLVLETTWKTQEGELVVTDAMAFSPHDRGQGWVAQRPACSSDTLAAFAGASPCESTTPHARSSAWSTPD
jgi:GH15 family glucan-1,4-alpha-glucosidase